MDQTQTEIINDKEKVQEVEPTGSEVSIIGSGITAPSAVEKVEEREIAYVMELPAWGEFPIVKSANAWWMDVTKVNKLFQGYRSNCTDEMACVQADITIRQLRYFRETHPDFGQAKQVVKNLSLTAFVNGLNTLGPNDLPTIRWALGKRHADYGGRGEQEVDEEGVIRPNIINNVTIGSDTTKIEEEIRRIAEFLIHGRGEENAIQAIDTEAVETSSEAGGA